MKPESIKARIRVAFKELPDRPFLYTTDLSVIQELGLKHDDKWGCTHISLEDILHIEGRKYRVVKIYTSFNDETFENKGLHGANADGYGEMYPFNLDVTYEVDEVK